MGGLMAAKSRYMLAATQIPQTAQIPQFSFPQKFPDYKTDFSVVTAKLQASATPESMIQVKIFALCLYMAFYFVFVLLFFLFSLLISSSRLFHQDADRLWGSVEV